MRTSDETSFPDLSAFIAAQLPTPVVQHALFLRLWRLGVKGDADQETNVAAAEQDWNQVKALAARLGQKEWANRATGELGIVAYLHGDYKQAAALMKAALVTAALEWDDGTEVRYLELVGNGMNGLNRHAEAMIFLDRAIRIAKHDGYVGTPFMAFEGKAEALAATGHHEPTLLDLTPTERRVLRLIADSKTSAQIAEELFESVRTVERHRANICTKLSLHGSNALLRFALAQIRGPTNSFLYLIRQFWTRGMKAAQA